jgi:hypothetical protein
MLSTITNISNNCIIIQAAGISFGQFFAGLVGSATNWRVPFLLISIPSLLCAALLYLTVDEPKRGSQEEAVKKIRRSIHRDSSENTTDSQSTSVKKCEENLDSQIEVMNPVVDSIIHEHEYTTTANGSEKSDSSCETTRECDGNLCESLGEKFEYSEKIDWSKLNELCSTKTVVLSYLQGIPGCMPWGMIYVFLNDYLSDDKSLSVRYATLIVTVFGIG